MDDLSRITCVALSAMLIAAMTGSDGSSATCDGLAVNNPAFSSGLADKARPCTPAPAIIPAKPPARSTPSVAAAKPGPVDLPPSTATDDKGGLVYRFGETVVCVGGSVSVTFAAGHNSGIRDRGPRPGDTCDVR